MFIEPIIEVVVFPTNDVLSPEEGEEDWFHDPEIN